MELSAKERDEYQIKVKYTEDFIKLLNNKLNEQNDIQKENEQKIRDFLNRNEIEDSR